MDESTKFNEDDDDDDDDENFEISNDTLISSSVMDLGTAITDIKKATNHICDNEFDKAYLLYKPWFTTSMYHSIGIASYLFVEAVLIYDQAHVQKAMKQLDNTIKLCETHRRKQTYLKAIKKMMNMSVADVYSSDEIHAELIYAESLSLKSLLSFLDEKSNTFSGFLKAGFKMRTAFNCYKDCETLLNYLQANNQNYDIHFETGVRIGIGCFNIILSHLPSKIARLLEFVGFSGDKNIGISEIMKCYNLSEGSRHIGGIMVLLVYNLIVIYFLGNSDGDLELCDKILNFQLKIHPVSALFMYFKGRLEFLKGNFKESNVWHTRSWQSQSFWPQLHFFPFWEIMWNHILFQEWEQAELFCDLLLKKCRWSQVVIRYQKASIMLMRYNVLTDEQEKIIDGLMDDLPNYKQKIAGKSIPVEKFCIKKSQRYKLQDHHLVLPLYELLFVWNLFKPLDKNKTLCTPIYNLVVNERQRVNNIPTKSLYDIDNQALLLFLESLCLVQMSHREEAEAMLRRVLALEKQIIEDLYLIPYSYIELANIHVSRGDVSSAIEILEEVKTKYTGYSLENRVHFQIHSALQELKK